MLAAGILSATGWAAPAEAHGREVLVKVTAATPEAGQPTTVTAVATFLDGDKAGGVPLTARATGPGRAVTARLAAAGRRGTYTAELKLPPGTWTVTVTAGGEHSGRGTAGVTVPAPPATTAAPATTLAPPSTAAPATSVAARPASAGADAGGGGGPPLILTVVIVAVAALVTGLWASTRRLRRPG
jgi:hypothetical protein